MKNLWIGIFFILSTTGCVSVKDRSVAQITSDQDFSTKLLKSWGLSKDFRENLSAVECTYDRARCILGSDEDNFLILVEKDSEGLYQKKRQIELPVEQKGEIDVEAAAYDGQYFYITGSHGVSRKKAKQKRNRHNVYRILVGDQEDQIEVSSFDEALQSVDEVREFFDKPLQRNGVNIEGLAIKNQKFYIGLRGPIEDQGNHETLAYVVSVPIDPIFSGTVLPEQIALHKLPFPAHTGIRGMARWQGDLILLAGDSSPDSKKKDKYKVTRPTGNGKSIYRWDPLASEMVFKKIRDLDSKIVPEKMKVEAIFSSSQDSQENIRLILEGASDKGHRFLKLPYEVK